MISEILIGSMFSKFEGILAVTKAKYEARIQSLESKLRQAEQSTEYYKQLYIHEQIMRAEAEKKNAGRLN